VFMDEPSAGVDPQARHNLWDMIQEMKNQNRTVLLTTHYMEEAQKLCDRVAIMDKGKIIDLDAPAVLIQKRNLKSAIQFSINGQHIPVTKLEQIDSVSDVKLLNQKATLFTSDPIKTLTSLMEMSRQNQYPLDQMVVKEANLEDLFLDLTGRDLRE